MASLNNAGLSHFWQRIKGIFATKSEVEELKAKVTALETAMGGLSFRKSTDGLVTGDSNTITFVIPE